MSNLAPQYYTKIIIIYQTTHEPQFPASVSTLAVASAAHLEEISLSSRNAVMQADSRYTKAEQDSSVSYRYKFVLGCYQ